MAGSKDGVLAAFDGADGRMLWSQNLRGPISATPAVTPGGIAFVANEWGELIALDARNGHALWQESIPDDGFHASPAVAGGRLYIGSINGYLTAWGAGRR
ncbi:MAG TPA: hypothetical protein ENJ79_04200 [Gammaproteobacteria bacterium]|nr:hypothetical protein [Gammaproteobacteria bacterium]